MLSFQLIRAINNKDYRDSQSKVKETKVTSAHTQGKKRFCMQQTKEKKQTNNHRDVILIGEKKR